MTFQGFVREDGRVGIRNHLLVLSNSRAAGNLASIIASHVTSARCFVPQSEYGREARDRETIARTVRGLAANPNVGAVLVVGVKPDSGYPELSREALLEPILALDKPVDSVFVDACGGFHAAVGEGLRKARILAREASRAVRREVDFGSLCIGIKCGLSDPTSGFSGNLVAGRLVDDLVDEGGMAFFSETTEVIGAEHLAAKRFPDLEQRRKFLEAVAWTEAAAKATGQDIRSINPVPANIAAGITTLEEKSLGALSKSGSRPIRGVLDFAEAPPAPGLYFVDSWMATVSLFLGFTAAGAVLNIFQMGGGWLPEQDAMAPGHDIGRVAPTIYMTGNPYTYAKAVNDIDFDAGGVIRDRESVDHVKDRLRTHVCAVASGMLSKVETLNVHEQLEMYMRGPTL